MDPIGKVALVTGAARRVGRAIALALADAGCDIAIHYRTSSQPADELAEQIRGRSRRALLVQCDLTDPQTPASLVSQTASGLGRLDILINNASVFEPTPVDQSDLSAWQRIFEVNVFAPAMLSRAAAPLMRQGGAGRIINLGDIFAERPRRGHDAYCASKAALLSLTRSLAIELAPQINVNAISPGIAVFPETYSQAHRQELVSRVPLRRPGSPEEVADLVTFLVTKGDYITGQVISIDGGRSVVL